ncbi:MAG: hypothetical protein NVSMB48_03710 [Marmoricola sp.]
MSALAQVLVAVIGVYGFVVGLLVFGSRGVVDAVIEHPIDAPEAKEPAAAATALNVVSLRAEAWGTAPAQAQAQLTA